MDQNYFSLRATFPDQTNEFRITDLEKIWYVSDKQVKRRLLNYQAHGLLIYTPGRGRGHLSRMVFTNEFQNEVQVAIQKALVTQQSDDLLFIMQLSIPRNWLHEFQTAIEKTFGFQQTNDTKQILRQISNRPVTNLDPLTVSVFREAKLVKQLGDRLVNLEGQQLCASLAHHWQSNADATGWTFYLRKGVHFHNGKLMTSHDVERTVRRAMQVLGTDYWQLVNLQTITCVDDYTIRFNFFTSEPLFARFMADIKYTVLDLDAPFDARKWIGTGAFIMQVNSTKLFTMIANENYFGLRSLVDIVEYHTANVPKIADKLYNPNDFSDTKYLTRAKEQRGAEFLMINMHRQTAVQDALVRAALYELVDVTKFTNQPGRPASHYFAADSVTPTKSLLHAQTLLTESSYAGETLVLGVLTHYKATVDLGAVIKERAANIGLHLELVYYGFDDADYLSFLENNVDIAMLADIPVSDDDLAFLEFVVDPSLLIQRLLSPALKQQLQTMVLTYKNQQSPADRYTSYLEIDNWLTHNHYLIYTIHATIEAYVHPMLANVDEVYDYKLAWQMPTE